MTPHYQNVYCTEPVKKGQVVKLVSYKYDYTDWKSSGAVVAPVDKGDEPYGVVNYCYTGVTSDKGHLVQIQTEGSSEVQKDEMHKALVDATMNYIKDSKAVETVFEPAPYVNLPVYWHGQPPVHKLNLPVNSEWSTHFKFAVDFEKPKFHGMIKNVDAGDPPSDPAGCSCTNCLGDLL